MNTPGGADARFFSSSRAVRAEQLPLNSCSVASGGARGDGRVGSRDRGPCGRFAVLLAVLASLRYVSYLVYEYM